MRSAGVIGLFVLAAVPGSAAAAPAVDPASVSRSVVVPSGATRTLTLSCPGTAVALHGAASSELGTDSIPGSNPQRWTFRFTSEAGDPRRRVRALVRCVALRVPAGIGDVRLVVGTARRNDVFVVAGATRRVALTCAPGMVPTGWGLERGSAGRAMAVAAASPTRRGFVFQLENTGDVGASATPRIRCLDRTQRAEGGATHTFATRVASFDVTGSASRRLCRRGEYSVSAGVSLDPADDVILRRATPTGERGGVWRFSGGAAATTSLVCLARRTGFR
jgi:hypothetical protein